VQVAGAHVAPVQQRMIVPLHGDERIAREILARDEPRRVGAIARAADPKALPLAHRVIGEPVVPADRRALRSDDRARCSREVAREEIAKRPLADETDACRIAFRIRRDALTLRECAHIALHHFAQRKDGGCELRLRQPMQEVSLVLRAVDGLDELGAIVWASKLGSAADNPALAGSGRRRAVEPSLHPIVRHTATMLHAPAHF